MQWWEHLPPTNVAPGSNPQESFHKYVEFDRPGERSSWIGLLLLTVTDVSTTCAVVIFRVKVICITSVDGHPRPQGFSLKKWVGHPFFKGRGWVDGIKVWLLICLSTWYRHRHDGEQNMHWEKTIKFTILSDVSSFIVLSQCLSWSPSWQFWTTWMTSSKGPILPRLRVDRGIVERAKRERAWKLPHARKARRCGERKNGDS